MLRRFFNFLLVAACGAAAGPQTAPTTAATDLSTPKGTLRCLNLAMRDGDPARISEVFSATTPDERRLVGAMSAFAAALAGLHHAAVQSFGEPGAALVTGDLAAQSADGLAGIEKAVVLIQGDDATVKFPEATDPPVKLRRVGGQWKLAVIDLTRNADARALIQQVSVLESLAREAEMIAADVSTGKFKTPERAAISWRNKITEAAAPRPTTLPSTNPG